MKSYSWQIWLAIFLILASAVVYYGHYLIFRDPHHIFIYLIGDIAFVFFEVLMVTLIIHRVLEVRERKTMLQKLNMVIGAFFSEVGTELIERFIEFDNNPGELTEKLLINNKWTDKDFKDTMTKIGTHQYNVESSKGDIEGLKAFLTQKQEFLLRLLENPNLLEHESFTDLLWAVTHLSEELSHRKEFKGLPHTDYKHLSGDIKRAYERLVLVWLNYMKHLRDKYPYLFSLAIRTNPFDEKARIEVME